MGERDSCTDAREPCRSSKNFFPPKQEIDFGIGERQLSRATVDMHVG